MGRGRNLGGAGDPLEPSSRGVSGSNRPGPLAGDGGAARSRSQDTNDPIRSICSKMQYVFMNRGINMSAEVLAIAEAAKALATVFAEREKNRNMMAEFSSILAKNNEILIREMGAVVRKALSDQVVADCNNMMQTLSLFYNEYANNPLDIEKLTTIEQQCQFVLNRLDDPEIALAGIRTYLGVASLRISALALKSEFQPGDRVNATNLAVESIKYAKNARSSLLEVPSKRVVAGFTSGGDFMRARDDAHDDYYVCNWNLYLKLDGKTVAEDSNWTEDGYPSYGSTEKLKADKQCRDETQIRLAKNKKIQAKKKQLEDKILAELPFGEIDTCVKCWEEFSRL
jgi:hypothetical protein